MALKLHFFATFALYIIRYMGKLFSVWHFVCRFKYVFIILFAALLIGFLDDNSLLIRSRRWQRIAELRREIADYAERFDAATRQLKSLDNDPKALEQMAREKYYMKRANEDVFVIRVSDEDATDETDTLDQDSIAQ